MSNPLLFHERTQRQIDNLVKQLPQSLIIEGASGSGVMATAAHLIANIKAEVLIIKPKKLKNNQPIVDEQEGSIIIQDIRQLYEQTRTKSSKQQVIILDTGERSITTGAQNAFLKLLEEPRPGVHFIIATHRPSELLPTVRSRSQLLHILPLQSVQSNALIDTLGVTDTSKRARLAFIGRGLPALITRLAQDDALYEARVAIVLDAKQLVGGIGYAAYPVAHSYRDKRPEALLLLEDVCQQLRVILRTQPDARYATKMAKCLDAHERIASGGNIRLQLAHAML